MGLSVISTRGRTTSSAQTSSLRTPTSTPAPESTTSTTQTTTPNTASTQSSRTDYSSGVDLLRDKGTDPAKYLDAKQLDALNKQIQAGNESISGAANGVAVESAVRRALMPDNTRYSYSLERMATNEEIFTDRYLTLSDSFKDQEYVNQLRDAIANQGLKRKTDFETRSGQGAEKEYFYLLKYQAEGEEGLARNVARDVLNGSISSEIGEFVGGGAGAARSGKLATIPATPKIPPSQQDLGFIVDFRQKNDPIAAASGDTIGFNEVNFKLTSEQKDYLSSRGISLDDDRVTKALVAASGFVKDTERRFADTGKNDLSRGFEARGAEFNLQREFYERLAPEDFASLVFGRALNQQLGTKDFPKVPGEKQIQDEILSGNVPGLQRYQARLDNPGVLKQLSQLTPETYAALQTPGMAQLAEAFRKVPESERADFIQRLLQAAANALENS